MTQELKLPYSVRRLSPQSDLCSVDGPRGPVLAGTVPLRWAEAIALTFNILSNTEPVSVPNQEPEPSPEQPQQVPQPTTKSSFDMLMQMREDWIKDSEPS